MCCFGAVVMSIFHRRDIQRRKHTEHMRSDFFSNNRNPRTGARRASASRTRECGNGLSHRFPRYALWWTDVNGDSFYCSYFCHTTPYNPFRKVIYKFSSSSGYNIAFVRKSSSHADFSWGLHSAMNCSRYRTMNACRSSAIVLPLSDCMRSFNSSNFS